MMTGTPAAIPKQQKPGTFDPGVGKVIWATLVGGMAVLFDSTIVAVAIKTLTVKLHTTVDVIQWVSTAYLLALAVAVPLVGWLQRVLGAKRLWMLALVVFLAGSILCSISWSAASLIAFRAFQGIGGGLLMPLMMTIVMQAARGQNLGKMATAIGLPIALGPILGPVIGGLILTHLHWSWMFWVNVPFCVAGLILAWLFLPHDAAVHWVRLDVVGLVLLAPGLAAMLYGLTGAAQGGAFTRFQAWGPIMAGVVLVGAFCLWALARREHALVNVRLLSHRPLATASVLMFLSGFGLFGAMFLLPLYFQTVRGATVLSAGVILIPQGVGTLLSRVAIGRFIDKVGPRWITLPAFLITALATIPFAFASTTTSQWWLMAALLFRGLGLGAALIPLMAHGFLGLAHDEVPDAAIVSRIIQQLGGSFGTAILATVLTSASVGAASLSDAAHAFDRAFWWAVAFSGLAVLISLILPGDEPAPTVAPQ